MHESEGTEGKQLITEHSSPEAETQRNSLDGATKKASKSLYERTSRRSFLSWLAKGVIALVGAEVATLLPIDRSVPEAEAHHTCSYWKYCNFYGYICTCCGGNDCVCPYGTTPGSYWWGCCSGQYVQYWDCCGGSACGQCSCNNTNPPNRYPNTHFNLWCGGVSGYVCTTACATGESC